MLRASASAVECSVSSSGGAKLCATQQQLPAATISVASGVGSTVPTATRLAAAEQLPSPAAPAAYDGLTISGAKFPPKQQLPTATGASHRISAATGVVYSLFGASGTVHQQLPTTTAEKLSAAAAERLPSAGADELRVLGFQFPPSDQQLSAARVRLRVSSIAKIDAFVDAKLSGPFIAVHGVAERAAFGDHLPDIGSAAAAFWWLVLPTAGDTAPRRSGENAVLLPPTWDSLLVGEILRVKELSYSVGLLRCRASSPFAFEDRCTRLIARESLITKISSDFRNSTHGVHLMVKVCVCVMLKYVSVLREV